MPKFVVDLSPIGYNFKGITTASDKGRAVRNLIVRYLEGNEQLGLFIWKQREEYGDYGWRQKIEEMASEIIGEVPVDEIQPYRPEKPEPPKPEEPVKPEQPDNQLNLFEFEKFVSKQHPGTDIAHSWKMHNKMQFMEFDRLADMLGDKEATFSVKLDGELCCLYFDGQMADLVTVRGTVRRDMPVTKEAAQLLGRHKSAAFLGELYAIDEAGKPRSYMKAATILRDPKGGSDESLRFSVFDMYSLDGIEYEALDINTKMKKIQEVFSNGKFIHPALTVRGKLDKADELWAKLETDGWEGLVVHFGADLYKIKPIQSYDMVVIGVNKSDKFIEQISAVLCSFVDKEGRFRLSGAISGGFNDEERIRMLEWAQRNKVMEDDERIWVDPFKEPLIVEIEAIEVNEKPRPTYEFKGQSWVKVEDRLGGTLRFPQFVRQREDKEPTHDDAPVEQALSEKASLIRTAAVGARMLQEIAKGKQGADEVIDWITNSVDEKGKSRMRYQPLQLWLMKQWVLSPEEFRMWTRPDPQLRSSMEDEPKSPIEVFDYGMRTRDLQTFFKDIPIDKSRTSEQVRSDFMAGLRALVEHDRAMMAQMAKEEAEKVVIREGVKVLDLGGDWGWWDLQTQDSREESRALKHCGRSPNPGDTLYSLRYQFDEERLQPVLTAILNNRWVMEIRGEENHHPQQQYYDAIVALLKDPNLVQGIITEESDFEDFRMSDLDPQTQKEVLEANPGLIVEKKDPTMYAAMTPEQLESVLQTETSTDIMLDSFGDEIPENIQSMTVTAQPVMAAKHFPQILDVKTLEEIVNKNPHIVDLVGAKMSMEQVAAVVQEHLPRLLDAIGYRVTNKQQILQTPSATNAEDETMTHEAAMQPEPAQPIPGLQDWWAAQMSTVRKNTKPEPARAATPVENPPMEQVVVGAEQLRPGKFIRTVNGAEGEIVALSPRHSALGPLDFDVVVKWAKTMDISDVHPTTIKDVWG